MKNIYYSLIAILSIFIIVSCSTENTPIYQLSTTVEPSAAGTVSPSSGEYDEGEQVQITASPNEHWVFDSWSGGISGSTNPANFTMDSDKSITALFVKRNYPLNVTIEGEGTVAEEVVQAKTTDYPYETNVQLTANPAEGWVFSRWEGDATGSENPILIEITGQKTVTAVFERDTFVITYTLNGEGQVTETLITGTQVEDGPYEYESTVELTAVPAEGWQFTGWAGELEGTDNPQTITIDSDKSVSAIFERKDYSLTINTEGEGTVVEEVVQAKTTDYPFETLVQLTANAADGWVFVRWDGDVNGSANPAQVVIEDNKEVTAVFYKTISGIYTENFTLNKDESPYYISGDIQVGPNSTFIIEPGVKIIGNNNALEVFGNFKVDGSSDLNVVLESIDIKPGSNSPNDLYSIEIYNTQILFGNLMRPTGSAHYGSFIIKNSFLYEVNNNNYDRMYLWYPLGTCIIEENIFYNSGRISTGHRDVDVLVRSNYFYNDTFGSSSIGYAIENWASYNDSETIARNNTFANIDAIAVSLPPGYSSASLDAMENYWNTDDIDIIKSMIYDRNDDLNVSNYVIFEPFLNSPGELTPVLPDSLR